MISILLRRIWPHTPAERGVFWSIVASMGNSIFAYLAVTYSPVIVLYLGELGLSKTQIGAISSLLPFSGLLALVVAPAVARWGLKRTFLTFFSIRKGVSLLLVFAPLVLAKAGLSAVFAYVAVIVGVFAVCRAVGETAYNPWSLEFVPPAIRGKYGAVMQLTSTTASLLAVAVAGYVMGRVAGLDKYVILIVIGVAVGVLSVWWASFIPRESATPEASAGSKAHFRVVGEALRNREYMRYLAGFGLTVLAAAVWAFLPLFMKEKVGLSTQAVVTLQTGSLLGAFLSSYLWGWMADRYGSKPVMLINLALRMCVPLAWLIMPRQNASSLIVAQVIAFFDGAASIGFGLAAGRLLFVRIVPPAKKTSYLSLYYAWSGLTGGIAPLIAGRVLDVLAPLSGRWGPIIVDAYTSLFVAGSALFALSLFLFSRLHSDAGSATRAGG